MWIMNVQRFSTELTNFYEIEHSEGEMKKYGLSSSPEFKPGWNAAPSEETLSSSQRMKV